MFNGKRLKHLRISHNMTQNELAGKLSLSTGCISRYEKGIRVPSADVIFKLAVFFNVSTDYLFGR